MDKVPAFFLKNDPVLYRMLTSYSGHSHQCKVIDAMKEIANEKLNRDYPNIKKGSELSVMNKCKIDQNPLHKKKGVRL